MIPAQRGSVSRTGVLGWAAPKGGMLLALDSELHFPVAHHSASLAFWQQKDCFLKNQTFKHGVRDLRLSNNI